MQPGELLALMPFAQSVGVELTSASPSEAVGRLTWSPQRCTTGGLLHGGALMTLADSVAAVCAFLNLPPDCATATTTSTTHLFRSVRDGTVTAVARPVHVGRSMIVVRAQLTDDKQRLVAETTQTQAVLPSARPQP
jgi:1,4-dihydroxy-2-naphthoyl-CoA hydrolase